MAPRLGRFPLRAPTWPGTVERPPVVSRTGLDYDTSWARRPTARAARAVLAASVVRPAVKVLSRPEVHGRDRLEGLPAPAIFAANHHSHWDTGLLLSVVPDRFGRRAVVAAAADYFFSTRAKGAFNALAFGAVPVERHKVNRRSAEAIAALVADGWSLVIYPEGGRSPDGWNAGFRGGAAYLSVRTGVPVVPVYLEGTRELWPKGRRFPRPARVSVTFGGPVRAADGEDARKLAVRVERAVAVLADERHSDWWTARRRAAAGTTPSIAGPEAAPWRRHWALPDRR